MAGKRATGVVKWFSSERCYGFITPDDGSEDVFVHQSEIQAQGFRTLGDGENVEFDIVQDQNGRSKASHVTGPGGVDVKGGDRPYGGGGRGYRGGGGYRGDGGGGYGGGGYRGDGGGGYGGGDSGYRGGGGYGGGGGSGYRDGGGGGRYGGGGGGDGYDNRGGGGRYEATR